MKFCLFIHLFFAFMLFFALNLLKDSKQIMEKIFDKKSLERTQASDLKTKCDYNKIGNGNS